MNEESKNIKEIDAYLSGDLTKEESKEFEQRLKEDKELRNDLRDTQFVTEAIEGYAFKATMKDFHAKFFNDGKSRNIKIYYLSGIAASIILLAIFIFKTIDNRHSDYYAYFNPYPGAVTVRGNEEKNEHAWKAFEYYDQNKFDLSVTEFEKIPPPFRTDEIEFYKAISYLAIKKPEKALKILKYLNTDQFKEQTNWYLSLCYLLTHDQKKSRSLLEEIKKGEYGYEDAQKLLKSLN